MLRNQRQAALNDLLVAWQEAADYYRDEAEYAGELGLGELFRELARERESEANELEDHVRLLHDLPKAPDTDRETLHNIAARIRAALSGHRAESLLHDRLRGERALQHCVELALEQDLPPETAAYLRRLRDSAAAVAERLERADAQLRG